MIGDGWMFLYTGIFLGLQPMGLPLTLNYNQCWVGADAKQSPNQSTRRSGWIGHPP